MPGFVNQLTHRQADRQRGSAESASQLILLGCYGPAGLEELGQGPPAVVPFLRQAATAIKAEWENLLCVLEGNEMIAVSVFGGGTTVSTLYATLQFRFNIRLSALSSV